LGKEQKYLPSCPGGPWGYWEGTKIDELKKLSSGKPWTFTEVRPDVIVGFTPGANFMNGAQGMALYLSLCRELYGEGATIAFPGTKKSWKNQHTDTCSDILAKQGIYLVLHGDKYASGPTFNSSDGKVATWEAKWLQLCQYFGLVGGPPGERSLDF
jgi:hypothetical protein